MTNKRDAARQKRAAEAIKAAFIETSARLAKTPFPAWISQIRLTYRVRKAPNGTVDGQAMLENLPPETDTARVLLELEKAKVFAAPKRFKNTWLQIGFIGAFQGPPTQRKRQQERQQVRDVAQSESSGVGAKKRDYDRYSGQDRVLLNSQSQGKIAGHLVTARKMADLLDNRAKKPTAVFIRWYWSPTKRRPKKR